MDTLSANLEVGLSESSELATWNRPRSDEELRSFVEGHHALLPEGIEVE